MDIKRKILEFVQKHSLITKSDRVLASLSAGPDSTFMVLILSKIKGEVGFELAAAYFNHGIREASEIEEEEELCRNLTGKLGIPLFIGSGDVPYESKRLGIGLEEAARIMRYRFLEEQALSWGATKIALGHNMNDQVETILHHIIRGTGLRGLTGIPVCRDRYIRPIICCKRSEIEEYLELEGERYATDRTNLENSTVRNRIRNILLPLLKTKFNPSIEESLLRLRENSIEALTAMEKRLESITVERSEEGPLRLKVDELKKLTDFEIYLAVDSILKNDFSIFQDVERSHFDSVKKLIAQLGSGRRVQLPFGIEVSKEHEFIVIRKTEEENPQFPQEASIPGPGRYDLEQWGFSLIVEPLLPGCASKPNARSACFASISFPIRIRRRKRGDRMELLGLEGSKKLSDIFIDRKLGISLRDKIPIFEDEKGIFWIPGIAIGKRARIREGDIEMVKLTIYKTSD